MPTTLSCGTLIVNPNGELLLCHATGTSRWDIPKGIAEPGESPMQAAVRETAEETGLHLAAGDLLDLGRFAYRRDKDLHLFAAVVEAIDVSSCACRSTFRDAYGRVRPEMDRFEWVAFARVPERVGKSMAALFGDRLSLSDVARRLQTRGS